MAGVEINDFSAPDEVRSPERTTVELVRVAGGRSAGTSMLGSPAVSLHLEHDDGSTSGWEP